MDNKNPKKKRTLNNTLINIINMIQIIIMIFCVVLFIIYWLKTKDVILIFAVIGSLLSTAIGIYTLSKEKN